MSEPRRTLVTQILELIPILLKQHAAEAARQTLIHGDAHFWNFLIPKDSSASPILIDWQSWEIGFVAEDLSYMIGLHWYPERRARYEKQLLEAYLAELYQHDIRYSFAELWYDYRLHLAKQLLTPIAQSQIGVPALV
jgi:aminoglycoside phosphotransferase (APT) family kinase protein